MRSIIYLVLLVLAFYGSAYGSNILFSPLLALSGVLPATVGWVMHQFFTALAMVFVHALIGYRLLCWVKARNLTPPAKYSGFMAAFGGLVVLGLAIVVGGYAFFAFASSANGLSGVPLGFAAMGAGLLSVLPVVVCESHSLYALLPAKA